MASSLCVAPNEKIRRLLWKICNKYEPPFGYFVRGLLLPRDQRFLNTRCIPADGDASIIRIFVEDLDGLQFSIQASVGVTSGLESCTAQVDAQPIWSSCANEDASCLCTKKYATALSKDNQLKECSIYVHHPSFDQIYENGGNEHFLDPFVTALANVSYERCGPFDEEPFQLRIDIGTDFFFEKKNVAFICNFFARFRERFFVGPIFKAVADLLHGRDCRTKAIPALRPGETIQVYKREGSIYAGITVEIEDRMERIYAARVLKSWREQSFNSSCISSMDILLAESGVCKRSSIGFSVDDENTGKCFGTVALKFEPQDMQISECVKLFADAVAGFKSALDSSILDLRIRLSDEALALFRDFAS